MKLKTFGLLISTLVFLTGSAFAVALVVVTDFLHATTEAMERSIESVYAAEELELALVLHNRDLFLAGITGERKYKESAEQRKQEISELIETCRRLADSPEEVQRFRSMETRVKAYFTDRGSLAETETTSLDGYIQASRMLEPAYLATEDFVQINREQSLRRQAEAARHNDLADILGYAAITFSILLVGVIVVVGHRFIIRRMTSLRDVVRLFGRGDFKIRAEVKGLDEISEIAHVFNEVADRLDRARESNVRFLASIAHDLRNPLGAIRTSAELLIADDAHDPAERRQMLEIISRQAMRLDTMVGDLQDVAKSESGRLKIRPGLQDLGKLVSESARLYENASPTHKVVVRSPDSPLICRCDGDRMSQVFNNLLSNAIKYTPYGGTVTVDCQADEERCQISVKDEGIGIDHDEIDRIFEPFRRSKNTMDTIPGVGLGLATSKRIVELHGGKITVESEKGRGSVFRVFLPRGTPAAG